MLYTITCNPALDYVVHLDDVQLGAVNRIQKDSVQYGGKGINVSRMLKELSMDSVALGFVAGFTGRALEQGLRELGLHTDFVKMETGLTRINVKIKSREESELNGSGPSPTEEDLAVFWSKLDTIQKGDWVVLSGSCPKGLPQDFEKRILEYLHKKQVHTILDITGERLKQGCQAHPFLIKPNRQELEEICGYPVSAWKCCIQAAQELQKLGARNVLVSCGAEGAILLDEQGKYYQQEAAQGQVCNSVGAGDSMVAGVLTGLLKTENWDTALCLGAAAGAATAFSEGIGTYERVKELYIQLRHGRMEVLPWIF